MPSLTAHHSSEIIKMLYIGDSGAGKTGSLASLAGAGYNLRIIDCDNGLDPLANILQDPRSPYPKGSAERVHFQTIREARKNVGGRMIPKSAKAWNRAMTLLSHWKNEDGSEDLGPIADWGPRDILVIDSLSFLSQYALNAVLALNARLGQHPQLQDWGAGQTLVEGFLDSITSDDIGCHVILICHVAFIGEDNGPTKGYPRTLGKALPPKVGTYFNNALMAQTKGQGANQRRVIHTNTTGLVELKNSAPLRVQKEYPLESGLADYFKAILGSAPGTNGGSK